ncbi:coupling factor for flagellin transcription and translation [Schinkia azotoformans LMG 9581]|uniref:Coupling factor for flagellin transcription and translation n=2 Tax=Schinkia azotoformans TaxID=1454 RepID=K6BY95_SCHAZ|nr:coupling factor for flagellin transcription and translation [Schinkia azotoformans LMG 9581]
MYPYMLTISFILHVFAFFWIFLLSMRLKRTNEIEKRQAEIQKEIEDLFQSYLLEMKEENEKLLNLIDKSKPPINKREKVTQQPYQTQEKPKPKEYTPPMPSAQDRFEQSLNSKVVLLHEQGFKAEEIAQKLNKGKTEIELILKFNGSK